MQETAPENQSNGLYGPDPRLYGGSPVQASYEAPQPAEPTPAAAPEPIQRVPLAGIGDALPETQKAAAAAAKASAELPPFMASVGAAMHQSWFAAAIRRMTKPDFGDADPEFRATSILSTIPYQLTAYESKFIQEATNLEDGMWRKGVVEDLRFAADTSSQREVANILGAVASDPLLFIGGGAIALSRAANIGRAATAATAGTGALALGLYARGGAPISTSEIMAGVLFEAGAGGLFGASRAATKTLPKPAINPVTGKVELTPQGVMTNEQVAAAVNDVADRSLFQTIGDKLQWNITKTFKGWGKGGEDVARLLDDNSDLTRISAEAEKRAIHAAFTEDYRSFETLLLADMKNRGAGLMSRLGSTRKASEVQRQITDELYDVMHAQEQAARTGTQFKASMYDPKLVEMAESLNTLNRNVLREMQKAGVEGAEMLASTPGWLRRKWSAQGIEDMREAFKRGTNLTDKQAMQQVRQFVKASLQRANPHFDDTLANDVASAVVDRAIRKGYFEDTVLRSHQGGQAVNEMRDVLIAEGLSPQRVQRALDILEGKVKESGKASFLKPRLDFDYAYTQQIGGKEWRIADLFDRDLVSQTDQYLKSASGLSALAKHGVKNAKDVQAMRENLLRGIKDTSKRREAAELFDNVLNDLRGLPAGDQLGNRFRMLQGYNRMVALGNGGLWQVTEFATQAAKFGAIKTLKHAIREMPVFRHLWDDARLRGPARSTQLRDVLMRQSENDLRLRPFTRHLEDNFELPQQHVMQLKVQQGEQLIPYLNGMKAIHAWQARTTANLMTDLMVQGGKGNKKALQHLKRYGLEEADLKEIGKHGMDVQHWPDGLWDKVRAPMRTMMDEAVLMNRIGDMPAWAKYDKLGKFIFTFRSFVLGAHNKLMAGGLSREGGASAMLLLWQAPLAALMAQVHAGVQGKGPLSIEDTVAKSLSIMGGMGLFADLTSILTGNTREFGSPGMIAVDRAVNLVGSAASGDPAKFGSALVAAAPLINLVPALKAIQNNL